MTEVELALPPALFASNPRGLIDHMGLYGRHIRGERWAVRPQDHKLVTSCALADETGLAYRFDHLSNAPQSGSFDPDPALAERFERERVLLINRMVQGDMAALFHQIQLNIVTAPHADLIDVVRDAYEGIGKMPMESTKKPAFPNRSAHVVVASDVLIRRVRLPGILFRFAQDPDAINTLTSAAQNDTGRVPLFGSSSDWYHNVIGIVHYLGPLLSCLSPRFWCLPATRPMTAVLFSLGLDINGFDGAPRELMQLVPTAGRTESLPHLKPQSTSWAQAIHWWTFRVDQMFRYLSDPTTFIDLQRLYAAHAHHHWMLTFGETFGLMTSVQCAGRDVAAQRSLMNNLFDLISRITGADVDRLCTLRYAEKRASDVRSEMPESVATLLMPAVDRAVNALAELQKHFFIQHQRGDEEVRLYLSDGAGRTSHDSLAIAKLLKLFRDATHGYGGKGGEAALKSELDAGAY